MKVVAMDAIPIANEIRRRIPIGESLDDCLGCPGRSVMLGHIEVEHLSTTMFQHDEHEQHPHGDRRHREELD